MGRVLSPNDVFYNFEPWSRLAQPVVQNSQINDAPTSYYTHMVSMKEGGLFHWNPYLASGVPGVAWAALVSPFVVVPVFSVPLVWVYTAIVFLKLNVAYWFAYLWLREERLGEYGATVGALVVAGAGIYSVRWLRQATNATALYPALLWVIRRMFRGRPVATTGVVLIGVAYVLAGFPAVMAYGAWVAVIYTIHLAVRTRTLPVRSIAAAALAAALALLITAPLVAPFAQFLERSGYLEAREDHARHLFYPWKHARSFIDPDRLGNPATHNWRGDPALGLNNDYFDATLYVGLLTIPLFVAGLANRKARTRWFWLLAALVVLGAMFGAPPVTAALAGVPGFRYSLLTRMVMLLPVPAGYLAGAGMQWIASLARRAGANAALGTGAVVAVLVAADLALLAGRFFPYLEPARASVPPTPTTTFLSAQPKPFRIAAFFDYLQPNTSEIFRIEDIRSKFLSEGSYRKLMLRIDPRAWDTPTHIRFDSRTFNFGDPLLGMLGVRYIVEHKTIDIVKWHVFAATVGGVENVGGMLLEPGALLQRTVPIAPMPFYAIEIPIAAEEVSGAEPHVHAVLSKAGRVVFERRFTPADISVMNKIYVPVRPFATAGERLVLTLRSAGIRASLGRSSPAGAESPFFYGRVTTPIVFDRELPDGRLFRNVAELPRFWSSHRVVHMSAEEFLARRDVDFRETTVVTSRGPLPLNGGGAGATVRLEHLRPDEQRVVTDARGPFLLASSEKLTPELRVTVDGARVTPVEIHTMFAGVPVPAGRHVVVFSRRIGHGWWWPSAAGVTALVVIAAAEIAASLRRRRVSRPYGSRRR